MNSTPFSTLHITSTTPPGLTGPDREQPLFDALAPVHATDRRALVLGGGGSAGNAWLIGVIAGLLEGGLDATTADLLIGTSAGATAAAQITGASPTQLLADILSAAPAQPTGGAGSGGGGRIPPASASDNMRRTGEIIAAASDPADMRRRLGAASLEMDADPEGILEISVARHRCRPAARPALAAPRRAHHRGRCRDR